jgi:nucleotide-binding universal stress UspA family protein
MKNILVPTDFSKISISALEVAVEIAKKANSEITVLHVVEEAGQDSFSIMGEWKTKENWSDKLFTLKLLEKAKAQLEKLVLDSRFSSVKVNGELRLGMPFMVCVPLSLNKKWI